MKKNDTKIICDPPKRERKRKNNKKNEIKTFEKFLTEMIIDETMKMSKNIFLNILDRWLVRLFQPPDKDSKDCFRRNFGKPCWGKSKTRLKTSCEKVKINLR